MEEKENKTMAKLEEILKRTVKEKYLSVKGENLKTKLQKALNLYVNDLAQFPDGSKGQVASLEVRAKDNDGELVVSYYPLPEKYDEKKLKQIQQNFSFNSINFSITYAKTSHPEITQVDYSEYKGRSGATSRASS